MGSKSNLAPPQGAAAPPAPSAPVGPGGMGLIEQPGQGPASLKTGGPTPMAWNPQWNQMSNPAVMNNPPGLGVLNQAPTMGAPQTGGPGGFNPMQMPPMQMPPMQIPTMQTPPWATAGQTPGGPGWQNKLGGTAAGKCPTCGK